jgi:hypothetical protein
MVISDGMKLPLILVDAYILALWQIVAANG